MVAILVSTEAPEGEQFNNLDLEKIETMNVFISIDWAQNGDIIDFAYQEIFSTSCKSEDWREDSGNANVVIVTALVCGLVLAPDCSSVTPPPPPDLWSCHTPPASQYIILALLVDTEFMDIHICRKCI